MADKELSKLTDGLILMIRNRSEKSCIQSYLDKYKLVDKAYLNRLNKLHSIYIATPLMVASQTHNFDVLKILIEAGSDVNLQGDRGKTALLYAIESNPTKLNEHNRRETIKLLIELMGENIKLKDALEKDALLYAIEMEDNESVKFLIEHGADVNTKDRFKKCALFYAVSIGSVDILRLLVEQKADVNCVDDYGRTPLMYVRLPDVVQYLIRNGANLDVQDKMGETALMKNNYRDQQLVICQILEAGANIYLKDNLGKTALEHAYEKNNPTCIEYLMRKFLRQICDYFNDRIPENISKNIREFIETKNEEAFPIKKYHVFALSLLVKQVEKGEIRLYEEKFQNDYDFLVYFICSDFEEKLWADVINRLDENMVEVNGQLLIARKIRAKSEAELKEIEQLFKLFNAKRKLAEQFYDMCSLITPDILKMANKLFSTNINSKFAEEFNFYANKVMESNRQKEK